MGLSRRDLLAGTALFLLGSLPARAAVIVDRLPWTPNATNPEIGSSNFSGRAICLWNCDVAWRSMRFRHPRPQMKVDRWPENFAPAFRRSDAPAHAFVLCHCSAHGPPLHLSAERSVSGSRVASPEAVSHASGACRIRRQVRLHAGHELARQRHFCALRDFRNDDRTAAIANKGGGLG